ncbi:MAG: hypothetical protein HC904_09010 [Blastochloris sp.]|nr:hypothetical protein [Blastochloris sp.]
MKTSPPSSPAKEPKRHIFGMGLGVSILFHAALLALIGGVVIIQQNIPQTPFSRIEGYTGQDSTKLDVIDEISEELSDPSATDLPNDTLEMPDPMGGSNSLTDASLPELVSVAESSNFLMPSVTGPSLNIGLPGGTGKGPGTGPGTGTGTGGKSGPRVANIFGGMEKRSDALEGFFYDFKVHADGTPTGLKAGREDTPAYQAILSKIMKQKTRDFSIYSQYNKAPNRLYRNMFITPGMGSTEAPKAFGVEAQGGVWLVYYSGYISPPESGRYKFSAAADNMVSLYLDGEVAAFGSTWGSGIIEGVDRYRSKDGWIQLNQDKSYFAEVFIADDGGSMNSRILVEKDKTEGTHIFQVGPTPEGLEDVLKETGYNFGTLIFKTTAPK